MAKNPSRHWSFFRAGGVDQVVIEDGDDVASLVDLDKKLWVALACPTKGLDIDEKTLAFVDSDGDGRIRAPEVIAAIQWCKDTFKDLGDLFEGGDAVPLASINGKSKRGKEVLAGAKRVLENLGKAGADSIALSDVTDTEKIFAETRLNGDGIVPAATAEDDDAKKAIEDVIVSVGSVPDRSGKPGVDEALVARFFGEAGAWVEWRAKADADAAILPAGAATEDAAAAIDAVRAKVDDYFTRCRLAALDPPAARALNATEADFAALAPKELSHATDEIARLPLARIEPARGLPLDEGINPAWIARLRAFAKAVETLLGARRVLTEDDWERLSAKLAAYRAWKAAEPQTPASKLGVERVRALVSGGAKEKLLALVREDAALEPEFAQLSAVEQLVRYRRDLVKLLRNYVSFADFFAREGATFQAGTLFLDGRAAELCLWVEDPGKHAALAGLAQSYLVYCDCTRKDGQKRAIVAAFTDGDTDALMVGRNGLFFDRGGADWDATITKIVENPISIRQAFWSPYKRFVRFIEEQVSKRATAAEAESTAHVEKSAGEVAAADKTAAPAAAPPAQKTVDVGTVAAIGVAVAGLATFLTTVIAAFLGLGIWMPIGLLGLVLAISGPSMLVAWLKLRQRNLGPILDASGWAINGRVRINTPFGRTLTKLAQLPRGARRSFDDPYAEQKKPVWLYVALAVVAILALAWLVGKLDAYLPDKAKSDTVLHRTPAAAAPSASASAAPK